MHSRCRRDGASLPRGSIDLLLRIMKYERNSLHPSELRRVSKEKDVYDLDGRLVAIECRRVVGEFSTTFTTRLHRPPRQAQSRGLGLGLMSTVPSE